MKTTTGFQGEKCVAGSRIAYTDGVWNVIDEYGQPSVCKGVSIISTGSGGALVVHPVGNGPGSNYTMDLLATDRSRGVCLFDKVIDSGTTAGLLAEITLWLE
jgi:hypothetical protein